MAPSHLASSRNPLGYCSKYRCRETQKGITTLAFVFKGGVMLATDHPPNVAQKMFPENVIDLNSHVLVAYTGKMRKCSSFLSKLQSQYRQHEHDNGKIHFVAEAAKWVAEAVVSSRCPKGMVGLTVVGWDDKNGACIYYTNNIGELAQFKTFAKGSGLAIAYGVMTIGECWDLSYGEAATLAKRAICAAAAQVRSRNKMGRGGEFGGFISGYYVCACGLEPVFCNVDLVKSEFEIRHGERNSPPGIDKKNAAEEIEEV